MPFSPTVTHESLAVPGAKFAVHRLGFSRRAELDAKTLAQRQRMREIEIDHPPQNAREVELSRQLAIAEAKAMAVPADQLESVIENEVTPIARELAAASDPETRKRRAVLSEEYGTIEAVVREVWIRAGLIRLEGDPIMIDDGEDKSLRAMTVDELMACGSPELAKEIWDALRADGQLSGKRAANFNKPGTSGGSATGPETTIVSAVRPAEATSSETASAISLAS